MCSSTSSPGGFGTTGEQLFFCLLKLLWSLLVRDLQPDDAVVLISAEAVRLSQRRLEATDWARAWERFLGHKADTDIRTWGLGDTLTALDTDEESHTEFIHLHPP